jgi:hypothetical protein
MAVGSSGRIVLEVEPALKRALHSRLAGEGRNLKGWFLEQASLYLNDHGGSDLAAQQARWDEPAVLTAAETVASWPAKGER